MTGPTRRTALVIGASGYLGHAVAIAFVRAGWTTYGLVRSASSRPSLNADEIISVLGSTSDHAFVEKLANQVRIGPFDVIVSCTEDIMDYVTHFNDTMQLLKNLAKGNVAQGGGKPLVLFTSGCKDYGQGGLHGEDGLVPHAETSPLNPPPFAKDRASHAVNVLGYEDLFDAVLLRPTTLYGYSSSYYGPIFDLATKAAEKGVLELTADPNSIMHGTHVDDCAAAYLAIAEADRAVVKGQVYNISSHCYETLFEVANAVAKIYKIEGGVKYLPAPEEKGIDVVQMLIGFSQWVSSEKLRKQVGWSDRRKLFSENVNTYRKAYEVATKSGHSNIGKVQQLVNLADNRRDIGEQKGKHTSEN